MFESLHVAALQLYDVARNMCVSTISTASVSSDLIANIYLKGCPSASVNSNAPILPANSAISFFLTFFYYRVFSN